MANESTAVTTRNGDNRRDGYERLVIDWTADDTTAADPQTLVLPAINGELISLTTDPGSAAPTDNYDITIEDALGVDVLQGVGANRHTTTTQQVYITVDGTETRPVVTEHDVLTLKIAGNSVVSATGRIVLVFFAKDI